MSRLLARSQFLLCTRQARPNLNTTPLFNLRSMVIRMAVRPLSDAAAEKAAASIHQPRDPNTLSNYNAWRTKHTIADFAIDFDAKRLVGYVTLFLERLAKGEPKIVLDTSYLNVSEVVVSGSKAKFELAAARMGPYGSPLTIEVDDEHANNDLLEVRIGLETTKECTALQWLTPTQTSNKKHPYMFSQCQAIHARSLFPCQDTPDVKSKYTFNIRSALPVLASGLPTGPRNFEPGRHPMSIAYVVTNIMQVRTASQARFYTRSTKKFPCHHTCSLLLLETSLVPRSAHVLPSGPALRNCRHVSGSSNMTLNPTSKPPRRSSIRMPGRPIMSLSCHHPFPTVRY